MTGLFMKQLLGMLGVFSAGYVVAQVPDKDGDDFWMRTGVYLSLLGAIGMAIILAEFYTPVLEPQLVSLIGERNGAGVNQP